MANKPLDHTTLLPPNQTRLERTLERVMFAGFKQLLTTQNRTLWSADECPLDLLPWLAWAVGVEKWRPEWDEPIKRESIRMALEIARKKGTRWAVNRAVSALGGSIMVQEWQTFKPPKKPHTFEVVVSIDPRQSKSKSAQFVQDLTDEIDRVKPLRSHYIITQQVGLHGDIALAGTIRSATSITLYAVAESLHITSALQLVGGTQALTLTRLTGVLH